MTLCRLCNFCSKPADGIWHKVILDPQLPSDATETMSEWIERVSLDCCDGCFTGHVCLSEQRRTRTRRKPKAKRERKARANPVEAAKAEEATRLGEEGLAAALSGGK